LHRQNTIEIVFVFDRLQCAGVVWAWAAGPCASSRKTRRCNVLSTSPYPHRSSNSSRKLMAKDYRRLWNDAATTTDEGRAVRTLAEILLNKEGRTFISNLDRNDAELCIKILDRVSRGPYRLPPPISDSLFRALQSTTSKPQRNMLSSPC